MNTEENQSMMTLGEAIELYVDAKKAEFLSPRTIESYVSILKHFSEHIGQDKIFSAIETKHIRSFLGNLNVSKKTALNAHITLSSLWTWAVSDGLVVDHVVRRVKAPEPEQREIIPFTNSEIHRILESVDLQKYRLRNRAIVLILLDTGVRATELCTLTMKDLQDVNLKVFGKGAKERNIPMSRRTLTALSEYLKTRKKQTEDSPVFAVENGRPMDRGTLRKLLDRAGNLSGVPDVHAHRFRHTFAINFLRNSGDAIALQDMLGHSTLDMVKRYVHLAESDIQDIHRRASPVENWKL